jgi:iron complex outermembrane receptor protein
MHGLSLKSDSKGTWDWDVVASYFHQNKDLIRSSAGNFGLMPSDAATGVGGTMTDASGTGWSTLDLRGDWRPDGNLKSKHQVSFGYHFDRYELDSITYGYSTTAIPTANLLPNWRTSSSNTAPLGTNSYGKTETQALYLQDSWMFSPDWKLVLGGRLEHWSAYDGSNYNAANTDPYKQLNYKDRSDSTFSPKASLSFQATEDWSLRGSLGKAYRFPTVAEMFQSFTDANGAKVNDPNLKPEHMLSGEIVAERLLQNGMWRTSLFWENKRDALINQTDISNPAFTVSSIQNVDKVRTRGVETSLQLKDLWVNRFDLNGSVTYVDSTITKDSKNPGLEGTDQPRIPDWRATLMGIYRANDKLSFSLAGRYSGRQHNSLYDTVNKKYTDVNPNVYGAVSHYFVIDAKAVYKMNDRWESALGVNNLNNFKYYVNPNPYPQRTWFASLKFDY